MAVNLSPVGGVAAQFFDNAGNVLTGGKLYTYAAGTTTPQTTYTTSAGNVAWSNPIILDAAGRVSGSGEIWLSDGIQYKFILRDSNDVLIATYDNITGINSNFVNFTNQQEIKTATAGQTVFNLTTVQYSPGTNSLSVFVDGVNQYGPGAQYAYVETDADTVTFTNGLHVGAEVKFTTSQLNTSGAIDAEQVSYTPPFTNSVATNVEAKLAQYVSVIDFGAVGDGVADDTVAIQTAVDAAGVIYFPPGQYNITDTIILGDKKVLYGATPQFSVSGGASFNNDTVIFADKADFTDGQPMFKPDAATTQRQAIGFVNLTIRSNITASFSSLSTMESTGPIGVSVNGIKNGIVFDGCAFRNLKTAVSDQISPTYGYLDKTTFNDCYFLYCYLALELYPTAGLAINDCYFDECFNWIKSNRINLHNARFNNSSFSSEFCQIEGTSIICHNPWFEGGNNWFKPSIYLEVRGGYFSEAFSASGSTKFSVELANDNAEVVIAGVRVATNTRLFNFNGADVDKTTIKLHGNYNGTNFANTSSIYSYFTQGLKYEGTQNTNTPWNVSLIGNAQLNGELTVDGDGVTRRFPNLCRSVNWETSITFTLSYPEEIKDQSSSTTGYEYAKFAVTGANNGSGGTIAYYAEIVIYNGYDAVWGSYISGPDAASYAVTLTNKTSSSVDVEVTESHGGAGDVLILESATENCKITF